MFDLVRFQPLREKRHQDGLVAAAEFPGGADVCDCTSGASGALRTGPGYLASETYLFVTDTPFFRDGDGPVMIPRLWQPELRRLVNEVGPVRVLAPESRAPLPDATPAGFGLTFRAIPDPEPTRTWANWWSVRRMLREEVEGAGVVHTCCTTAAHQVLTQAHDLAVRLGKTTLLVAGNARRFAWSGTV